MSDPAAQPSRRTHHRRAYQSPARETAASETRRQIRDAAEALFLRDGYVRSTTKAIAKRAGVAEKTLFLAFPSKPVLLSEIIRVRVRGDSGDAPVAARDEWRAVLDGPGDQLFARFATLNTEILGRTARLLMMAEAAATTHTELAALRDRGHAAQRALLHDLATALANRSRIRPNLTIQQAADALYALTNEAVYVRLVDECGWTPSDYTTWLTNTLGAALTPSTPPPRTR